MTATANLGPPRCSRCGLLGKPRRDRSGLKHWEMEPVPLCPPCVAERDSDLVRRWVTPTAKPPPPNPKPPRRSRSGYLRTLSADEAARQARVRAELKAHPEWANGRVAQLAGSSLPIVRRLRGELEGAGEIPYVPVLVGESGRRRRRSP